MKITILQRNIEWANPQANIARADEAISCLPDADLDMEALQAFRKKFPVLDDADPFTLI